MKIKNLFKSLLLVASLALATLSIKAAPYTVTYSGTNNYGYLLTGVGTMNTIYVYNPTTNVAVVNVIDSPTNVVSWTNTAYTNYTISTSTYTNIYTNYFGVTTTNTYSVMTNAANAVGITTNNYRTIATLVIPASSQASYTIPEIFINGLFTTNTGSTSATNLVIVVDASKRQ